jgi:hypothetical protein
MSCCFEKNRDRGPGTGDLRAAMRAMRGIRPLLFVGWVDPGLSPGEAQRVRAITLGFPRTESGIRPTCAPGAAQ